MNRGLKYADKAPHISTDGSRMKERVGTSVTCSVFQAEIFTIKMSAELLQEVGYQRKRLHIYVDSQAVI